MYSSTPIFTISLIIFFLQYGTQQQVNACQCKEDHLTLFENLERAEWATHIQVVRKETVSALSTRYTTKFLKIFKVPAAWPYVDLENSTGTIFTDGMSSCSVHLVPMSEYLLAGNGMVPLNSAIDIAMCSAYFTRPWPDLADNVTLIEQFDSWATATKLAAAENMKNKEKVDNSINFSDASILHFSVPSARKSVPVRRPARISRVFRRI